MIKSILRTVVPNRYQLVPQLISRVHKVSRLKVMSGPFEGMNYIGTSVGSAYLPKLLGTYELELHATISQILKRRPGYVLNIGSAEGYYSVGFAARLPEAEISSWEASKRGKSLAQQLATLNEIDKRQIDMRGLCTISDLKDKLASSKLERGAILIVDIEGAEAILLDPKIIPELRACDMLIEVHECFLPGVRSLLLDRFQKSHQTNEISAQPRLIADWPKSADLPQHGFWKGTKLALMNEKRPVGMSWFYFRA